MDADLPFFLLFLLSAVSTLREVLIEKHFRGVTPRTICEYFWEQVNKHEFKQVSYSAAMDGWMDEWMDGWMDGWMDE